MTPPKPPSSPAKPVKPAGWLLFLEGDLVRSPLLVGEGANILGRDRESCEAWRTQHGLPDAAIVAVADPSVSRVHALVECGPAGCTVKDLRSANKTSLAGNELTPMAPYPLADRARLSLAQLPLMFVKIPAPGVPPVEDTVTAPPAGGGAAADKGLVGRLAESERTLSVYREQLAAAESFARDLERQVSRLLPSG